jgi:protein-S-isoprenylcysteine O-methyltransferase Ste14
MAYILAHSRLGFCWWDILALIVLIAVIVVFLVKYFKMRKEEKELEDQLSETRTDYSCENMTKSS